MSASRAADCGGSQAGRGRRPVHPGQGAEESGRACGAANAQRRDGAAAARFLAWLAAQPLDGSLDEEGAAARLERSAPRTPCSGARVSTLRARPQRSPAPLPRHAREQPAADGRHALPGRQRWPASRRHHRPHPHGRRLGVSEMQNGRRSQGHDRHLARGLPRRDLRRPDRRLARTALWRHGLDFDHGTGHGVGSASVRARGPGADQQARHRAACPA